MCIQGVGGFFKGIGVGVVAALTLPIAGICVAGYQVTRGLINTPEAIHEKSQGKKWDKKERVWKPNWYSLEEEAAEVLNQENPYKRDASSSNNNGSSSSSSSSSSAAGTRKVVDTTLYEILEVSPDARPEDIRRQYYRLARKYHPDKNRDDPDAKKRFQQLGEAYQVLGEEERRAQYDLHGQAAAQDMPIIDSSLFFMMLFGSEALEPYIGKLKMAMFVEMVDAPGSRNARGDDISEEMFAFEQRKREVQLAILLRQRIQPYVDAMLEAPQSPQQQEQQQQQQQQQVEAWTQAMIQEARNLCQLQQREQKRQKKQEKARKNAKEGETVPDAGPTAEDIKQFEETLPLILETMLSICLIDIETTVRAAAKKVLKDMSVSVEVRRLRAEALVKLGKGIQQETEKFKTQHKDEKVDPLRRMEDALIKAAQKADEERYKREGDHTGPPTSPGAATGAASAAAAAAGGASGDWSPQQTTPRASRDFL
ncbi:DnaJ domain-containing protein, putative [Eimeria maxima]|uniref:DnaJ domain-containing protein, putative n=1 Tax=Eimeria maxima TaxID=5804 RepID=U6MFY8_EIMMA|nr:DnaJ domain-containing protein, putative [Eimeria maxima]CDJ61973.1 DnaJ domain-containing protein, putative [Eimeria maxima]